MSRSSSRAKITDHRHRKTEQEEDEELLQDEEDEEDEHTIFRESPPCIPPYLLTSANESHQRRRNARLPSPGSKLVDLSVRKRHQRYPRRRNGTRKNAPNNLFSRIPPLPPWCQR